ncbi:hypothetical protein BDV12DRAFT_197807 [Aspergillus spectabilis]
MSDSHTSQQRQYPPRSRSALVITALKKYQQKLRPKFSNFAVRPLYDRFRDKVVDRTRAADETRRGHEPPTSSIGRDPYDEESPHPSLTISAEPSHLPSSFGDPRALSSSRTLLNSITSTCIGVHGSVNSDSRSGSSISIDRRNCLRTKILVRLPEDRPDHALLMIASLDTQCWGADLMALRQFERLNKDNRIVLHPVDAVIEPLKGPPVRVVGIARGLTWTLEEGYRTYTTDFYVIDMDRYDVLIGWDTIFKYELLHTGADLGYHAWRTAQKAAARRQRIECRNCYD